MVKRTAAVEGEELVPVGFKIKPQTYYSLWRLAEKRNLSKSELLRQILEDYLLANKEGVTCSPVDESVEGTIAVEKASK